MKHVYGIIPTSPAPAQYPEITGVRGADVRWIGHNGLAALVSDSPYGDYNQLYKPALVQMLAEHQRVTEQVMGQVPALLPVKFGTLLEMQEVQDLLTQAQGEFAAALQQLAGKVEVELVVTWQPERIFAELAQDQAIAQLRAAAVGRTPEEVQQLQIIVGQLVKDALDGRRKAYQQEILERLRTLAEDTECNLTLNEQVVANLAFLLPAQHQPLFDQEVAALDAQYGGLLNFKIVGPLPAYSFSTVEVLKLEPAGVDWARQLLGLDQRATATEIRNAYRHRAQQHHPDVARDDPTAQDRFAEIAEAYELLQYCHETQFRAAHSALPEQDFCCDFSAAAVTHTMLVNICRSFELAG